MESYGILEFSEKVYFLVTILWSALGRTFHSLVSLAKFGQIQLQDTNSIFVTLDWYFQHGKKVLLDQSRNFCSFRDMDHLIIINKQRKWHIGPF